MQTIFQPYTTDRTHDGLRRARNAMRLRLWNDDDFAHRWLCHSGVECKDGCGVDAVTVSARVVDDQSGPVLGVVVDFSSTAGTIEPQAVTNEQGWASVTLETSASATDVVATVTAQLGDQILKFLLV